MNQSSDTTHDKPLATHCLRVLMVTGIFPPDIGGPATYVPAMSSELVKRGHKVSVLTLSDSVDHADESYSFPVRRIRRSIFKPWRFLLTVAAIMRESRQAQLLYVNGLYLEAVIANYLLRKPMVQKIVGDWAWERSTNKAWVKDNFEEFQKSKYGPQVQLLKALRTFCVRRADTLIAPSNYLARVITTWGVSESKIFVIYNAVEVPSSARATVPLTTRFKIVTVGRLVAWKQIDHLIEALAQIEDAGLVIVGDGPERNRLESLACAKNLNDRVFFAGQRSKEETLGLMVACDLFVLNSTYEGFPHVVLEAMCAGLPVVATAVGGTPELVKDGENGILIAPNANGALSKTLMKLASSSEERQRLAMGAERTTQRFQGFAMIEKTEAVLRNRAY
ncbi:MAG: glycosyltransferase [Deltaproteobacteria bacterium]|nr:glycosyltransferase [Deltaproteobacteria bacterium]